VMIAFNVVAGRRGRRPSPYDQVCMHEAGALGLGLVFRSPPPADCFFTFFFQGWASIRSIKCVYSNTALLYQVDTVIGSAS